MHENAPDPLVMLLAPPPLPPPREEVFARTLRALRWQRRLRQAAGIGVLLGAYAAGLLTVVVSQPPVVEPRLTEVKPTDPPLPVVRTPPPTPELEWKALEKPQQAAQLYLEAGDRYLGEANPADALRCYGNALDKGKEADLEVTTADSWLLMAIKNARKKERAQCAK